MSLGLQAAIFAGLSGVLEGKRTGGGETPRMTARRVAESVDFSRLQRSMADPKEATKVKGYQAINYEQLNRIWDDILRNAYTDASERQDTKRLIK